MMAVVIDWLRASLGDMGMYASSNECEEAVKLRMDSAIYIKTTISRVE